MLTKRSNYCCFAVSGKIELKSEIRCKAKNFTLAGQTAPGDGVCIIKNEINFGGSENFIIRHMRFRVGEKDASGKEHNAACLRVENANNFIIDHCSFSWASEENTDFIDTHFSTVQWCISSEGLYYSVNKKVHVLMVVRGEELHLLITIICLLIVIAGRH